MSPRFTDISWDEYVSWQKDDRTTLRRINRLIDDIVRNGQQGIGNPEALVGDLAGWWSRRIDERNRLVYRITEDGDIEIAQCRGHYQDR